MILDEQYLDSLDEQNFACIKGYRAIVIHCDCTNGSEVVGLLSTISKPLADEQVPVMYISAADSFILLGMNGITWAFYV